MYQYILLAACHYFEDIVLPNFVLVKLLKFCINTELFTLTLQHIFYHINPFFVTLFIGYENIIGDLYHITLKLRNNCIVFEVLPALTGDLLGNMYMAKTCKHTINDVDKTVAYGQIV
jgi:hypothetical protein